VIQGGFALRRHVKCLFWMRGYQTMQRP
jgi:hypothetical protein